MRCLATPEELTRFFQGMAETYRRDGYRNGRFNIAEIVPMGGRSALVTVDWELLREDGSILRGWHQSYTLARAEGAWRILVSTFHVK